METTICDLCGSDQASFLMRRRDRFSDERFAYVTCDSCGLIYLNPRPRPSHMLDYYPDNYEAHVLRPVAHTKPVSRRMRAMRILRSHVEAYAASGTLLDVGCATGEFLVEMRDQGWQVRGVELSPVAADFARHAYDLDVFTGSVADFACDERYRVITLWDVLEHVYSPLETLQALRQWVTDDGYLIFSIPNIDSYDRHLFGDLWIGWDVPRHLHLFNQRAVGDLLSRAGFVEVDRKCILGGPGAFMLSLRTWVDQRWGRGAWDSIPMRVVTRLLPLMLWPYKTLAYHRAKGPVMTYVARPVGI